MRSALVFAALLLLSPQARAATAVVRAKAVVAKAAPFSAAMRRHAATLLRLAEPPENAIEHHASEGAPRSRFELTARSVFQGRTESSALNSARTRTLPGAPFRHESVVATHETFELGNRATTKEALEIDRHHAIARSEQRRVEGGVGTTVRSVREERHLFGTKGMLFVRSARTVERDSPGTTPETLTSATRATLHVGTMRLPLGRITRLLPALK